MRTGLVGETTHHVDSRTLDTMQKIVALMKVLLKEAVRTAEVFVKACGRHTIGAYDISYALKYEAHEFLKRDIDSDFHQSLHEEQQHTYDTDDTDDTDDTGDTGDTDESEESSNEALSSDGDTEDDEGTPAGSGDNEKRDQRVSNEDGEGSGENSRTQADVDTEVFTDKLCTTDPVLAEMHRRIMKHVSNWDDWEPEDEFQQLLKRAVDKSTARVSRNG